MNVDQIQRYMSKAKKQNLVNFYCFSSCGYFTTILTGGMPVASIEADALIKNSQVQSTCELFSFFEHELCFVFLVVFTANLVRCHGNSCRLETNERIKLNQILKSLCTVRGKLNHVFYAKLRFEKIHPKARKASLIFLMHSSFPPIFFLHSDENFSRLVIHGAKITKLEFPLDYPEIGRT